MKQNFRGAGPAGRLNLLDPAWLACFSLLAGIAGQVFLYANKNIPAGLLFFFIAAAALVMSDRNNKKGARDKNDFFRPVFFMPAQTEKTVFFIIILIAVFMRLYRLDAVPAGCYADEASAGLTALGILSGKSMPLFTDPHAPGSAALITYSDFALIFRFFGAGAAQVRLTSAISGILAVPAVYFLIRYLAGPVPAAAGSFILAVMRWHINFSRIGFHGAFSVLAIILAMYFCVRAYYGKKTLDFALLGFMVSFSMYTYQSAWLFAFVPVVFTAYAFFHDRAFFGTNWRKIMLSLAIAIIAALPVINFATGNPGAFMSRISQVFILNNAPPGAQAKAQALLNNIKDHLLMFNYRGDANSRHNLPGQPELEFFAGIFAAIGFCYALTRLFNPVYFFFVSAFFILMSAGFFSEAAPHSLRTILAIPCVIFFMLVFAGKFIAAFKAVKNTQAAAAAAIAVLFLVSGASDFNMYFNIQARDPRCWEDFSTREYSAGLAAKKAMAEGWQVEAPPCFIFDPAFRFAFKGSPGCGIFDLRSSIPAKSYVGRDLLCLLPMEYWPVMDYFRDLYPGSTTSDFKNKYNGAPVFFSLTMPAKAINDLKRDLSGKGVNAEYFTGHNFTGESIKQKMPFIMLTGLDTPGFILASAMWSARLSIPVTGGYDFDLRSHGYSCVYIDDKAIVSNPSRPGNCDLLVNHGNAYLKKGLHSLKIKYETNDAPAYIQGCTGLWIFWRKPGDIGESSIPGTQLIPD